MLTLWTSVMQGDGKEQNKEALQDVEDEKDREEESREGVEGRK